MLWIAVQCHRLALDCALRAHEGDAPLAVCDRLQVLQASDAAWALGLRPGMRRATALSLAADLRIVEHDAVRERDALEQVAGWLLQFTPGVSLQPPDTVLLDVGASLRLFGGRERLIARVREGLAELGFGLRTAIAPTPTAAWLLASRSDGACIEHESLLAAGLGPLPVALLASAAPHREALAAIGVRRFADLARLPRTGLARRYGKALLPSSTRRSGARPSRAAGSRRRPGSRCGSSCSRRWSTPTRCCSRRAGWCCSSAAGSARARAPRARRC
jgi:protein ImuB